MYHAEFNHAQQDLADFLSKTGAYRTDKFGPSIELFDEMRSPQQTEQLLRLAVEPIVAETQAEHRIEAVVGTSPETIPLIYRYSSAAGRPVFRLDYLNSAQKWTGALILDDILTDGSEVIKTADELHNLTDLQVAHIGFVIDMEKGGARRIIEYFSDHNLFVPRISAALSISALEEYYKSLPPKPLHLLGARNLRTV